MASPFNFSNGRWAATVTTTTGESWQGLLQRDDPTGVTLRLAGGREIELSRTNITRFERLTRSLMPEGLETGLSEAELAAVLGPRLNDTASPFDLVLPMMGNPLFAQNLAAPFAEAN